MRILIAGATYYPAFNGQARFTVNLAEGLARSGHDVAVITQSEIVRPYQRTHNGVKVFGLQAVSLNRWYPGATISLFPGRAVRQIFAAFRPDVVHIQDHYPISQPAQRCAVQYGLKVMGTNHFMPENLAPYLQSIAWFKPGYRWALWHWMLGLFNQLDLVTAPSRTAAEILRRQGLITPVIPVSCGVDTDVYRPMPEVDREGVRRSFGIDPEKTVFLFVGRVDGEKRLEVLLRALSLWPEAPVQLVIAGKGAALPGLQNLACELNLGERVRFTGFIPEKDKPALLNSVDVFAMPSEAELLSIASLEAMACGRPLLAARSQALPELVDPGVNGLLFRPGDPQDAVRCMQRMVHERERWSAVQAASLEKVQSHALEYVIERYEGLYEYIQSLPAAVQRRTQLRQQLSRLFE